MPADETPLTAVPSFGTRAPPVTTIAAAETAFSAGNFDKALQLAERAVAEAATREATYDALMVVGRVHAVRADGARLMETANRLLDLDPRRLDGMGLLAVGAMMARKVHLAIPAIEHGLSVEPNSWFFAMLNSWRFTACEDVARAVEWAERAVAAAPDNTDALYTLVSAYQAADRNDDANTILLRALKHLSPEIADTAAAAVDAINAGRYGEARRLALAALERDPDNQLMRLTAFRARWLGNWLLRPFLWGAQVGMRSGWGLAAILTAWVFGFAFLAGPIFGCFIVATGVYPIFAGIAVQIIMEGSTDGRTFSLSRVDLRM